MGPAVTRRVWLVLGAAAALIVVLLYFNGRVLPPRVTVTHVTREDISSSITSNGQVEPVAPYSLRAKFDGFVKSVSATEGQLVRPGQLLVELDDRDIVAQLFDARARLATEEDDLHAAENGGRADQAARVAGDLRAAQSQRDLLQQQQTALTKLAAEKAATPEEVAENAAKLDQANAQVDQLRKAKEEFDREVQLDRARL